MEGNAITDREKELPERISCQACCGTGDDSGKNSGCGCCGGYGFLLEKTSCKGCGRECWQRPGNHTLHVGKRFRSFDGLTFIVGSKFEVCCWHCHRIDGSAAARSLEASKGE